MTAPHPVSIREIAYLSPAAGMLGAGRIGRDAALPARTVVGSIRRPERPPRAIPPKDRSLAP